MRRRARARRRGRSSQPPRRTPSVRVRRVFSASDSAGTAARPRRSSGTNRQAQRATLSRRRVGDVLPEQLDRSARRAPVLARERREELALAVAGHAGDADDLAGADREIHAAKRNAKRVRSRKTQRVHFEDRFARRQRVGVRVSAVRRRSSAATDSAFVAAVGSTSPVTRPARSTVQWWQRARISSSLWLM